MPGPQRPLILLTGATGYIGGRLLHALEARGERVRCLSRRPEYLSARVGPGTEVVHGDVLGPETLRAALEDVETAYYLVHSMGSGGSFAKADREAASAFASAARAASVRRIIYLGGLGEGELSEHLASRQEVGGILRGSSVPTIEFRSSIVIGSGSASFEMLRALVERLPLMVTPRWVKTRTQPIAIEDVVAYLLEALDYQPDGGEVFEIGGADVCSYLDLMHEYAEQRGLRRQMVPVPVLTPRLSSLWLHLVTPVYAGVGRELVDSLRNETVVNDPRALDVFPVRPRSSADAIARALANEDKEIAETRWSDEASAPSPGYGGARYGSRLVDSRSVTVPCPPAAAFAPIQRIGGHTGWYLGDQLWELRGALDVLVGGPGLRRGRRDPVGIQVGDTIDFWRVERFEQDRLLGLVAEMKVPGRAWLQFEVQPDNKGGSVIRQTAISTRPVCPVSPTGTRFGRSTATSSAECCNGSQSPLSGQAAEPPASAANGAVRSVQTRQSRAASRASSGRRVRRRRCFARARRSRKNRPLRPAASGAAASQTIVSAPSAGVRSSGPIMRLKPGSAVRSPGVSAQPGCMALTVMPVSSSFRVHSSASTTCARLQRAYVFVPS
ncbi:MAG: DUF2867 domain-containing protein [Gaiellaceae bacterium]